MGTQRNDSPDACSCPTFLTLSRRRVCCVLLDMSGVARQTTVPGTATGSRQHGARAHPRAVADGRWMRAAVSVVSAGCVAAVAVTWAP